MTGSRSDLCKIIAGEVRPTETAREEWERANDVQHTLPYNDESSAVVPASTRTHARTESKQ